MLDKQDLGGSKHLLGDDKGAKGIPCRTAGIANDVSLAEVDAKGRGSVNASVHAGYLLMDKCVNGKLCHEGE